ncbi:MAG: hypothetical protein RL768_2947, partial [Nitrospirota bacterium]
MKNRQWRLKRKPTSLVTRDDLTWHVEETRALEPDEVMLQLLYISLDPGLQVYMSSVHEIPGGIVNVGDVVRAWAVGRVVESRSARFPVGSYARDHSGVAGLQDYAVLKAADLIMVDPLIAPLSAHLGVLGMPGLTAYFGLLDIGRPQAGETVVVSGASGAVGSMVGQIARIKGCRAIGIAGGSTKCRYVVEQLGFDECVDYKGGALASDLASICRESVDIYFDNTGGGILDACLGEMAQGGRIVFCGAVAEYASASCWGPANYLAVLTRGLRWEGLAYHRYADRFEPAVREMERWFREGRLRHREDVSVGLENFVPAFHRLFAG